jgi:predicted  nucleic acid-binding Zn-ribbon protein
MPKEPSLREKLVHELNELRNQKYELEQVIDKHNAEGRQLRLSFTQRNPGASWVGSSEWEQHMKKERQLGHAYAELEEKLKKAHADLDALDSPEERKLDALIAKLEDQITDIEEQISNAEDTGKNTTVLRSRKEALENQLAALEATRGEAIAERKTGTKAAKQLALTKPKAEHPHWEVVGNKWVLFPN